MSMNNMLLDNFKWLEKGAFPERIDTEAGDMFQGKIVMKASGQEYVITQMVENPTSFWGMGLFTGTTNGTEVLGVMLLEEDDDGVF